MTSFFLLKMEPSFLSTRKLDFTVFTKQMLSYDIKRFYLRELTEYECWVRESHWQNYENEKHSDFKTNNFVLQ